MSHRQDATKIFKINQSINNVMRFYLKRGKMCVECIFQILQLQRVLTVLKKDILFCSNHHHHHDQFFNREGRWGTKDDFATSFLHFSLLSTALWDLPNSRPVHSLTLSSHLFLCLPSRLSGLAKTILQGTVCSNASS